MATSWHGRTFRIAGPLWREYTASQSSGPVVQNCDAFFVVRLKHMLLNEQTIFRWFDMWKHSSRTFNAVATDDLLKDPGHQEQRY